jgi:hypothetical protein
MLIYCQVYIRLSPHDFCLLQAIAVVHLLRPIITALPPHKPLPPHVVEDVLSHSMATRSLLSATVFCVNSLMCAPGGKHDLWHCAAVHYFGKQKDMVLELWMPWYVTQAPQGACNPQQCVRSHAH